MPHEPEPWVARPVVTIADGAHFTILGQEGGVARAWTKDDAARIVACVNACAGINPDAVPLMLEALWHIHTTSENNPNGDNFVLPDKLERMAREALAKAKTKT